MSCGANRYVILGGGNGSGNHGDEAMWLAVASSIRSRDPGSMITTGGNPGWSPPVDAVKVLPLIHQAVRRVSRVPRSRLHAAAYMLLNRGSTERGLRRGEALQAGAVVRPGLERSWEEEIRGARALIFAGAGGLTDAHALHAVAGWGMLVALASRHAVPVAFLGHGVGPLVRSDARSCLAGSLGAVSLFTTRDQRSAALISEICPEVNVVAAPDWAILVEPDDADRHTAQAIVRSAIGSEPYICLSLRDYTAGTPEVQRRLESLVPEIIRVASEHGCQVLLIPTCVGAGRDRGDLPYLNDLRSSLPQEMRQRCHVVQDRVPAQVVRAVLGGAAGVFANRYHAVVFALAEGVPATAVALDEYYRAKMSGALEWYDEADRMIDARLEVAPGYLAAGIDLAGATSTARRQVTQVLSSECEAPFHSWFETLP